MVHDRRWRGPWRSAGGSSEDTSELNPLEQLNQWRSQRHDTAEFPALDDNNAYYEVESSRGLRDMHEGLPSWTGHTWGGRLRRPGRGILIGGGLLATALVLSGLTVIGIGPVRSLLGSDHSGTGPSAGRPDHAASSPSGSTSGSGPKVSQPSTSAVPAAVSGKVTTPDDVRPTRTNRHPALRAPGQPGALRAPRGSPAGDPPGERPGAHPGPNRDHGPPRGGPARPPGPLELARGRVRP